MNIDPYSANGIGNSFKDPYANKGVMQNNHNPYANRGAAQQNHNPYANRGAAQQNFDPYANRGGNETQEKEKGFRFFGDLKTLNQQMLHLSNNTLAEQSKIELLSQGQLSEVKITLASRVFPGSLSIAFFNILIALVFILTDHIFITALAVLAYLAIVSTKLFVPANLFYENISLCTTKFARTLYTEMEYWFKSSVVLTIIFLLLVSIAMFIFSFYESDVLSYIVNNYSDKKIVMDYINTISFSISLKLLPLLNIGIIFTYFKYINKLKAKNELIKTERERNIRNESMSRVEQVQVDRE